MTPSEHHAKFVLELQHKIAQLRNKATEHNNTVVNYTKYAAEQQDIADEYSADADQWQKLLDFAELVDADDELAHAFTNAVLSREDESAAEWAAEGAATAMSASERAEYDRDDDFAQDAADEERWAAESEAAAERYADAENDGGDV